ncbi:MAG TPA: hypothetical protein P5211_03530, partial [Anaerolineae bacterium]|nr:hypothetical protein [Anaerolineae bacterium]
MRHAGFALAVLIVLLGAVGGAYWLIGPLLDDRILPGVWLWRMPLGGLTLDEAQPEILREVGLDVPRFVLFDPNGQRWIYSAADLGVSVDMAATLARAYEIGHAETALLALGRERWDALQKPHAVAPVLVWDRNRAAAHLQAL